MEKILILECKVGGIKKKYYKMNKKDIISKILELEYYLTDKIIKNRGKNYKPYIGDEDQPKRDELKILREKLK